MCLISGWLSEEPMVFEGDDCSDTMSLVTAQPRVRVFGNASKGIPPGN
jgi:hypothetical protein